MASRLKDKKEKKLPCISVSIEPSIATDFKIYCWNNEMDPSKEIRKFVISFLSATTNYADFSKETQRFIAIHLKNEEKEDVPLNG